MSDSSSRGSPQLLEVHGTCDHCGREAWVAVVESGRYCRRHLPDEDLERLVDSLY